MIGIILALTVLGYFYTPYDPNEVRIAQRLRLRVWVSLGTDHFGRDVLSRILVGGGCRW